MNKINILFILSLGLVATAEAKVSEACKAVFEGELKKFGLNAGGVSGKVCLTKKETPNSHLVSSPVAKSSAELIERENDIRIEVKQDDVTGAQWTKTLYLKEQNGKCLIDTMTVSSHAGETSTLDWHTCESLTKKKHTVEYLNQEWKPMSMKRVPVHMEYPMANLCTQYHAVDVSQFVKPAQTQKKLGTETTK